MKRVTVEDPLNCDKPCTLFCLNENLKNSVYLHYVVSFRVITGYVEIFGGLFGPSTQYKTIVAPSWFGCYALNAASVIDENLEVSVSCAVCGGSCGAPGSALCQNVTCLRRKGSYCAIVAFKDTETAFGECAASHFVTESPAFHCLTSQDNVEWYVSQCVWAVCVDFVRHCIDWKVYVCSG